MSERVWQKRYDPGVPVALEYPQVPLFYFFDEAAKKYPQQACTIYEGQVITYQEMKTLTDRLACWLVAEGLKKGECVGIFLPNIPQFILAYFAILKAGGVVVALNPQYKQREIEFQINDAGVKVIFALDTSYDLLKSIQPKMTLQRLVLSALGDAHYLGRWADAGENAAQVASPLELAPGDTWLGEALHLPADVDDLRVEVNGEDAAVFQYSGGTTGIPKGAVGLHRNLAANTLQFRHWLVGLEDGQETVLLAIPMYHVYGMVIGINVGICLGAGLVLIADARNLEALLQSAEKYRVTFFPGVPTLFHLISQHPDVVRRKYDLRSIKACISGSAPLLPETKERFEMLTGAQLMEGYGLSEAPTATHCNPMWGEKRSGSIGLPLPDVDCRIVSLEDERTDLPAGQSGELVLRGPQVMRAYHNMPEETRLALRDGWLYTGDIAQMDAEGYFYLQGRKKELIKVGGLQVWPREIEEIITLHPKVAEAAVAGIPDIKRGEAPKAWVVLKAGERTSAEEIIAFCEERLAHFKAPLEVEFCRDLPRSTVGKVLRRELVRRHLESKRE